MELAQVEHRARRLKQFITRYSADAYVDCSLFAIFRLTRGSSFDPLAMRKTH